VVSPAPYLVSACSIGGARSASPAKDALARCRHVEVFDPERGKRVDDRVDHRGQGADRAGLPCPLGAQLIELGQARVALDVDRTRASGALQRAVDLTER
jgi:hypothetical protein